MKIINRIIALILCLATLLSVCSCMSTQTGDEGSSSTPDINVSVVEGEKDPPIDITEEDSIYDVVYENISYSLQEVGFVTKNAVATNIDNEEEISTFGIMYYLDELNLFSSNEYYTAGFYEILSEKEQSSKFEQTELLFLQNIEETTDSEYLCAYDYEDIGYDHFIYKNKYIVYYQETTNVIRYIEYENIKSNYNLSLGSIYDYDNNKYVYDESIFGEYKSHSGIELFGQEDYEKLEANLQQLSDQQLKNGYVVNEFNIVYISPEAIQAYLLSDEEDTFFGYSVDELSLAFGAGTALTYTENGFSEAQILPNSDYNWKSFLIKCGVGCGIILVGAILTPVTGGASFGCALITITKFAVGSAIAEGLGTLAIETVVGLIQGQTIEEAIKGASYKGLDAFANGFMIGAAVGSVGVVTGIIKPTACFVAGTLITLPHNVYKPIEKISVDDYVCAYNEETKMISQQRVLNVFCKDVYETITLKINGEIIETTFNHPFYSPKYNQWVAAGSLNEGDLVYCLDGTVQEIDHVTINDYDTPVKVYNFTVENDHTYFVSNSSILVHNTCNDIFRTAGNKAGEKAKAEALEDIIAGRNYKKWGLDPSNQYDMEIIKYVQKHKTFKGSGCEFAHAVDVNTIRKAYNSGKLNLSLEQALDFCSNPKNGILTNKYTHRIIIHAGKYSNPSNLSVILKARPSIKGTVNMILKAVGQVA